MYIVLFVVYTMCNVTLSCKWANRHGSLAKEKFIQSELFPLAQTYRNYQIKSPLTCILYGHHCNSDDHGAFLKMFGWSKFQKIILKIEISCFQSKFFLFGSKLEFVWIFENILNKSAIFNNYTVNTEKSYLMEYMKTTSLTKTSNKSFFFSFVLCILEI
jgi:hypothetical protein